MKLSDFIGDAITLAFMLAFVYFGLQVAAVLDTMYSDIQ
jgi:hypothetical protein